MASVLLDVDAAIDVISPASSSSPSAGEGQDAPAREESWRIVNVDGPLSQHRHRPSSQYIAGLDEGMPERAPHRVQRGITEWVDVPDEEGEADA